MNYKASVALMFVFLMCFAPLASAYPHENKYKDYNPTLTHDLADVTGMVYIAIRAGGSAMDLNVFIIRSGMESEYPFDGAYREDGIEIENQNPNYLKVKVGSSGITDLRLTPGNYTAYLRNGNAGQMENQTFYVGAKGTTFVNFLGHAVSSSNATYECKEKYTITKALYGIIYHSCDWVTVIDVPAHTEYRYWITAFPAHTEYQYRDWVPDETKEECFAEVNHTEMYGNTTSLKMVGNTTHKEMIGNTTSLKMVGNTTHKEMIGNTTRQEWVPEVNHTERQVSTWQVTKPAVPATNATGRLAEKNVCVKEFFDICIKYDYEIGHVHAKVNGNPSQTDFYYDGTPYHIVGNHEEKAFIVTPGTPEIPAEYGCVAGSWEVGTCPKKLDTCIGEPCGCIERVVTDVEGYYKTVDNMDGYLIDVDNMDGELKLVDNMDGYLIDVDNMDGHLETVDNMDGYLKVIVDEPAHCDPVVTIPAHWSEWSEWSDTEVTPITGQREVNTRWVEEDMTEGYYSEWSDVPEGSCAVLDAGSEVNEPCQTREVPATYKQEQVCSDKGTYEDVTTDLQSVVNEGYTKFAFSSYGFTDKTKSGIFTIYGELLREIQNPAPDYPSVSDRDVTIEYNDGCGNTKTISTHENTDIDLTKH